MKQFLLIMITACYALTGAAQNIGINATGTNPDPSAMLDVQSVTKGFLMPRMTTNQRTTIAAPAEGLKVYDTDSKSFWYYNGTGWIQLSTGAATNYWALNGSHIFNSNAGNVGIGLNSPLAPLHIRNDNEALRIQGVTPYISFYDNAGNNKSYIQNFNSNLYLGTPAANTTGTLQFYLANNPIMTMQPSGNIGVGTATPAHKLTVQTATKDYGFIHTDGTVIVGTYIGDFGTDGSGGWLGTKTNHPLNFFTNNSLAQMTLLQNGNVGIGTTNPLNKLQVGSTAYSGNDFAMGNGVISTRLFQSASLSVIASNANMVLLPKEGTGNLGINNSNPTNKVQIGSVGNTGFATNDLAIGNGTNAMAIFQTNASTLIGSTTDIVLKPRNNGHGRVGINTNTPRAPLDVVDFADVADEGGASNVDYGYLALRYVNFQPDAFIGGTTQPLYARVSIFAGGRIVASEFDANSDARIKNIIGVSNGGTDLGIVNSLHITDYTMKDRIKFGNKQFKKVIAQDVEKVYPQAISKHTDFIPNVYQPTEQLSKTADGYLLRFNNNHHISANAKKLQVITEKNGVEQFAIVAVPSDKEVIISATDINAGKIFVYGEEVDDFRTVDYEGLTTLNISATQELARLVKIQSATIENMQKQILLLQKRVAANGKRPGSTLYLKQAAAPVVSAR
jgi:Chaperone of endosialidase